MIHFLHLKISFWKLLLCAVICMASSPHCFAQSDVSILYYMAQEGARPGETAAAQELADNLFSTNAPRMFFLPIGYQKPIIAWAGSVEYVLDSLSKRDFTFPAMDVTADVGEFQSAMNEFEKQAGSTFADDESRSISIDFILEGNADPYTIWGIQHRIFVLNGWTTPSGTLRENINAASWQWSAENQVMQRSSLNALQLSKDY